MWTRLEELKWKCPLNIWLIPPAHCAKPELACICFKGVGQINLLATKCWHALQGSPYWILSHPIRTKINKSITGVNMWKMGDFEFSAVCKCGIHFSEKCASWEYSLNKTFWSDRVWKYTGHLFFYPSQVMEWAQQHFFSMVRNHCLSVVKASVNMWARRPSAACGLEFTNDSLSPLEVACAPLNIWLR